ncbi:MAG: beta-galactosidase [Candidatus Symbiobacter sp.]|nr:beta-galactosidase [Candidatus Symbiobacter sp.]
MELGVCYYPEQTSEENWTGDVAKIKNLGLEWVRIGEFSWAMCEPHPGQYQFGWLERVIALLKREGMKIILGTPTATPPKWLSDQYPDILASDRDGRVRNFGSRRHYCFSSPRYRQESRRITTEFARRFAHLVDGWQTDNEYGCHDTVLSYSAAAQDGFRIWLGQKYGTIAALNDAWGNQFWSMIYRDFSEIDLPNLTTTEANPSHWLDFHRYSSAQVVDFNLEQVTIIQQNGGRNIGHNYMGFFTDFDHYDVAQALDFVGWDSYPLGFMSKLNFTAAEKIRYARVGHPDIPAFHHELYRQMTAEQRFWVMEQQPGAVNWAAYNPAPAQGMVRLWSWQAFAHGAEVVSYFRFEQYAKAQEQFHHGLFTPERNLAQGGKEASQIASEIKKLGNILPKAQKNTAKIALVFDFPSIWANKIQPQGDSYHTLDIMFRCYSAVRQLGHDLAIIPATADFTQYDVVIAPSLPLVADDLSQKLKNFKGKCLLLPRFASKSQALTIDLKQHREICGFAISTSESLPDGFFDQATIDLKDKNGLAQPQTLQLGIWRDHADPDSLDPAIEILARYRDGGILLSRYGHIFRLMGLPDHEIINKILVTYLGIHDRNYPQDCRATKLGDLVFMQNFSPVSHDLQPLAENAELIMGDLSVAPYSVNIWRLHTPQ